MIRKIHPFLSVWQWVVFFAAAITLFFLADHHPWFYHRLSVVPAAYFVFWGLLALPAVLFIRYADFWWTLYIQALRFCYSFAQKRPFTATLLVMVMVPLICWYFRIQRVDSGDIVHFVNEAKQGQAMLVEHAPLETILRNMAVETFVWLDPYADIVTNLKLLNCFYGALFVLTIFFCSAKLSSPYSILAPFFLTITPAMALFCGYMEIYGLPLIAQIAYLAVGLLFLRGRASLTAVSMAFGLAMGTALWHGVLILGYLYVLAYALQKKTLTIKGISLQLFFVGTPLLFFLAMLTRYSNPFAGFITRVGQPGVFIPFNGEAIQRGYTLFSLEHLADFSSELILFAFAGTVIVLSCLLGSPRRFFRRLMQPNGLFLAGSAVGALALGFSYYPFIGMPLDWDLYSFMFPSLTLLGVEMMKDGLFSRAWRKRLVVLAFVVIAISSGWVLQNALFTRYPLVGTKIGPVVSWAIPNFYYNLLDKVVQAKQERHLYWFGDKAIQESPSRFKDVMHFMDVWCINTIAKHQPQEFDKPGWSIDMAIKPGSPETVYVFDKYGRVFLYRDHGLRWLFSPEKYHPSPFVAADIEQDGSVVFLGQKGKAFRISSAHLEQGMQDDTVWAPMKEIYDFLPESPSKLNFPVHMVDLAVKRDDGNLYVLDNYNRVWDLSTQTVVLRGQASKDVVRSLHFTGQHQPVTIDVNNTLSYDRTTIEFPFRTPWFFPIVRDFWLTAGEEGIVILDLNGNLHYSGLTPVFESAVVPGKIIDRFKKMDYLPQRDTLLLLDNRYRVKELQIDPTGVFARNKIQSMIEGGNLTDAYKTMRVLWKKGSQFTDICYELIDTERLRNIRGFTMYHQHDTIHLFVDVLPLRDDLTLLLDRWGRLVYEKKGIYELLEGSGITRWPRGEALDGALSPDGMFFLCEDGTVWNYEFPLLFGQPQHPEDNAPKLWCNLHDFEEGLTWKSIEITKNGTHLYAMAASG
ncbi:hypothetical protein GF373_16280, partial [bacterium]|nr:hypothetical protein [bacterium]